MEPNSNGFGPLPDKHEGIPAPPEPTRFDNGPMPPMPTFEKAHIPVRKRRNLWLPGLILMIIGLALYGAGWLNGSHGGSVYVDDDGFHMNINEAGKVNGIYISEFNLQPFNEVEVEAGFANVYFEEADSYGLEIRLPSGYEPEWEVDGGKLKIEADSNDNFSFQIINMEFTESSIWVYYPEGGSLESLNLKTGSGSIYAAVPYVYDEAKLETGSGGIEAQLYNNAAVEAKTGSGSIALYSEGSSIQVKAETGSGKITLTDGEWIDANVKTGSGSINIEGMLFGETVIESGSGSVEISGLFSGGGFYGYDISTGSGSIRVNGNRYEKNYKSGSGSDNEITVRTGSGSIRIEE
jgi:DUF4097 and DUF4098 domain-containing protein YvlB